mgnify:CR=1 FL=1
MLELNPDIVRAVIERTREFQAKETVVIPDEQTVPADDADWAMQVVAGHDDETVLEEGRALINDLEPDQQVTLMALMWVGRGDFAPEEWEEALEQGRDLYADNTADVLFASPMVSDYLEEGLAAFGYQE